MSRSDRVPSADADLPPAFESLWRTFRLGWRAEPKLLALSLGLGLLMMLPDALLALWLALLVDGVDQERRSSIVVAVSGLAVSATLIWFLSVLSQRVQRRFRDRVAIALESHVARLQASVPTIEHHERPDHLDRLAMLREQVFALDHMFMSLFSTLGWLFRLVVTTLLLASIHSLLLLLLPFALPAFFISTWRPAVERRTEESVVANTRLARHLFSVATSAPPGKEVRTTGTGQWLVTERRAAWLRWYRPVAAVRVRSALWLGAGWTVFAGAYVGAIVFVSAGLDRSVAVVTLAIAAGMKLISYVGATSSELGFLRGFWLDASRRLAWLEDYAAERGHGGDESPPDLLVDGIRFEQVSFSYPGTERLVLDGVDLWLPAGSVVAVVGENGAGKSTLVKLLSRMYAPASGRITVDGCDLADIDTLQWRQRLAGAFQDFARLEFAAQTSVGLGDLPRVDDRPAADHAVARAGASDVVRRLPEGLDTQLGPTWPGGAELSFGQWQKVALARGFMRDDSLLLILDEPTAALDAETEHALFERFAEAAKQRNDNGRITVLVSHRFSTVRMADLIVVLDGALVAEVGTHDELMARDGQYAELFRIQAAAYT
ncbi:MAG: ABC transporter ATP-binding protein [Actinomycetota bacterium]|nr:ABC transporter ATP-binding protein [Actinomycetota bacterium]